MSISRTRTQFFDNSPEPGEGIFKWTQYGHYFSIQCSQTRNDTCKRSRELETGIQQLRTDEARRA